MTKFEQADNIVGELSRIKGIGGPTFLRSQEVFLIATSQVIFPFHFLKKISYFLPFFIYLSSLLCYSEGKKKPDEAREGFIWGRMRE